MAEKKLRAQMVQVKESFYLYGRELFVAGQVIAANHPAVKGREHLFRPFVLPGHEPDQEAVEEPAKSNG